MVMGHSLLQRLAVGGWRLVVVGGWRHLVAVGGSWWLAVGGWWGLAVGGWWPLAVGGGSRSAVGGWWSLGAVLTGYLTGKKKIWVLKDSPEPQPQLELWA